MSTSAIIEPKSMTSSKERKRRKKGKGKRSKKRKGWRTAATSDIHELYELSVQEPEAECDFIDQVWSELRGRRCKSIREDFCGTAAASIQWVRHRRGNTAVGVDLDAGVLDWARASAAKRLSAAQRKHLRLLEADVRTVKTAPVDTICAMNFSYFTFKQREVLLDYFRHVRRSLVRDGLLMLDAYGGSESFLEMEEERDLDSFTYVWDQHHYNPVTGDVINHIHFRFPDGTKIKEAFTYEWRLWTLPEIRELLLEAGFRQAHVYWEGTDEETDEGDGNWEISTRGEACPGWIAYIVGVK